jgi:hypothetical protein
MVSTGTRFAEYWASMRPIRKIVVLGANGAMGAGAAAIFASAGIPTTMLARTIEKAEAGRGRAEQMSKGKIAPRSIAIGTYENDLATAASEADLIFECVSEDLETKRQVFALVDKVRAPGSIVATVSSGLSIAAMCAGQSDDFRTHFLGIHLFNPPTIIRGCEIIPHRGTDPNVTAAVKQLLEATLERVVITCADTPAFAGNRIGFKVLNEVAQLAEQHGVAYMDQLVGSHTGRALRSRRSISSAGTSTRRSSTTCTSPPATRPTTTSPCRPTCSAASSAATSAARPATRAASTASRARAPTRSPTSSIPSPAPTRTSPRSSRRCRRSSSA